MIDRCEFCTFWRRNSDPQAGHCHHNSPAMDDAGRSRWPRTSADDWCGQFEHGSELDDAARERWSQLLSEESQERMREQEEDRQRLAEIAVARVSANQPKEEAPDQ